MVRRTLLPFVLALAALLLAPTSVVAAADPLDARKASYQALLADLPALQNDDGGFGPAMWADNNTTLLTIPGAEAYRQTVFSVVLLVEERTDPLAVHRNTQGRDTSLAASHVPNARGWLHDQESSGADIAPGDLALFALAYGMLGDGNAGRVVSSLLETEAQEPGRLGARDANKVLFTIDYVDLVLDPAHNDTRDALADRSVHTSYTSIEGAAWALLARPDDPLLGDHLLALIEESGADAPRDATALAALALVLAGRTTDSETLLAALHDAPPGPLGRGYQMLAERMGHVEFSPHYVPPPPALGGINSAHSGAAGQEGVEGTQAAAPPAVDTPGQVAPTDEATFPVPTWVMMAVLLSALGALGAVGLAWGLKREQLQGVRKTLFEYIERNPGEHFSKIRRTLGIAPGTFQHHLTVLEHEGWITSHKDARYKRYFVNGNRFQKLIGGKTTQDYKQKFSALQNPTTQDVVRYLQHNPGATQKQVAQRLNLHASTVNWHAKRLKQAGLLSDEKVGKEVRYRIDGDTVEKIIEPGAEPMVEPLAQ